MEVFTPSCDIEISLLKQDLADYKAALNKSKNSLEILKDLINKLHKRIDCQKRTIKNLKKENTSLKQDVQMSQQKIHKRDYHIDNLYREISVFKYNEHMLLSNYNALLNQPPSEDVKTRYYNS